MVVASAVGDGVYVGSAGNPSTTNPAQLTNGFEVAGAEYYGLFVGRADYDGVRVSSAGSDGLAVQSASDDGVPVSRAGNPAITISSSGHHGFEVDGAADDGLHVGRAYEDGVDIHWAGDDGVYVSEVGNPSSTNSSTAKNGFEVAGAEGDGLYIGRVNDDGVQVYWASDDGIYVEYADDVGVYANTTRSDHHWGFETPDAIYAGSTLASGGPLLFVAQNGDYENLETGDVVVISGMGAPFGENAAPTPQVERASAGRQAPVFGVVHSRFVLSEESTEIERNGQVGQHSSLRAKSAAGPAAPGEFVLVAVLGVAQVKVAAISGEIYPGARLGVSADGRAASVVSDAAFGTLIGTALEASAASEDGLIWTLVNPN